jgi:hypothetical protein
LEQSIAFVTSFSARVADPPSNRHEQVLASAISIQFHFLKEGSQHKGEKKRDSANDKEKG